jgi:hypothetical protein
MYRTKWRVLKYIGRWFILGRGRIISFFFSEKYIKIGKQQFCVSPRGDGNLTAAAVATAAAASG